MVRGYLSYQNTGSICSSYQDTVRLLTYLSRYSQISTQVVNVQSASYPRYQGTIRLLPKLSRYCQSVTQVIKEEESGSCQGTVKQLPKLLHSGQTVTQDAKVQSDRYQSYCLNE